MSRIILEGICHNWGLIGPGVWRERIWKIRDDGTYSLTISFIQGDDVLPKQKREGMLSPSDLDCLTVLINEPWSDEETFACDGSAWEFRAFGSKGEVLKERPEGYIYGIDPYESITEILMKYWK